MQYVDAARAGLDVKDSVRAASNTNHALTGLQTVDGVSGADGERFLLRAQTSAPENGIWVMHTGGWTRAADADTSAKVNAGMFVFVEEGAIWADTGWVLSTNNPITLGTTALSFTQFSQAGVIQAGTGHAFIQETITFSRETIQIRMPR
jgi:phage-related tail fiber protein